MTFHHFPQLLWTAALAYTFGLRHAVDPDHIAAIDNVTRKLMQDGRKPVLVGFFFSLGHSTIVVLLSVVIALTASHVQSHFPAMTHVGGLVGTSVSALFLLLIAGINLLVLRSVVAAFGKVRRGEPYDDQSVRIHTFPARDHGANLSSDSSHCRPKLEDVRRGISLWPGVRHCDRRSRI